MKSLVLLLGMVQWGCLQAQVIEISGGTSSLYQATGGTVTVRGRSYTLSAGGGSLAGRLYSGGQLVKVMKHATTILGIDNVPFDLPTDIFDSGHYLTTVGVGVKANIRNTKVYAFAGATSLAFDSPFFLGTKATMPAAIFSFTRTVAPKWISTTKIIVTSKSTALQSFASDFGKSTQIAGSFGVGANHFYGAASVTINRERYDLKAAYYLAGNEFRRADVQTPLTSEPDRENILVTLRPAKFLSLSAGRNSYLSPVSGDQANLRSTINQAAVNMQIEGVGFSAILFESTYDGHSNTSMVYSASKDFTSLIHANTSYMVSRTKDSEQTSALVSNIQENISPRLTLTQTSSSSNGQETVGFGGSFLSNKLTLNADYETYYVPARLNAPFEEALIIDAQIIIFGSMPLHGGTFVAPDGRLLYTVRTEGAIAREQQGIGAPDAPHYAVGRMIVRGRVIDREGHPVMGAALLLDQLPIYTDSDGYFCVRERKKHIHMLTVLVDQFIEGGSYRVISAPLTIGSTDENETGTIIIVDRIIPIARGGLTR